MLDKNVSSAEKIQTQLREQGITVASILRAIEMAIGVLVEGLLPRGGTLGGKAHKPPPENRKGWMNELGTN